MTSPRGHSGSRALGSIKVKGIVFPPLPRAGNDSSRQYFVESQLMVHGDSMGLPTALVKGIDKGDSSPTKATPRSLTSKTDAATTKVTEEMRELQTRERQYKIKIQSLQKIIEQLKQDKITRDADLAAINHKLQEIEEHYKLLYEEECSSHKKTKQIRDEISQELEKKCKFVEEMKRNHQENMKEIKDRYEGTLTNLTDQMNREVSEREERINKMKKQMADFLNNNSRERQQQLEELTKELGKVSEEANDLRIKLKSFLQNKKCERCNLMKQEMMKRDKKIAEQDMTIKELMTICKKFDKQLTQQDFLLVQFQESNREKTKTIRKK